MTESEIVDFTSALPGVAVVVASEASGAPEAAWGDTFFFYDPDGTADRRIPFATILIHDYEGFDTESNLNRPGVFRLNAWVSKETFQSLFGDDWKDAYDLTALDTTLPHPVYGAQGWVAIINPGPETSDLATRLLTEAHGRANARHERAAARRQPDSRE